MPITTCANCSGPYSWQWEDAFDKFGFGDGDGQVETETVADFLSNAGYAVRTEAWSLHNTIITSIQRKGIELISPHTSAGYDDPRKYLPKAIVRLLDKALPANGKLDQ
jgi:hypothetical protein